MCKEKVREKKQHCSRCGRLLSRYNDLGQCFHHFVAKDDGCSSVGEAQPKGLEMLARTNYEYQGIWVDE
jgi:hypothetical protein